MKKIILTVCVCLFSVPAVAASSSGQSAAFSSAGMWDAMSFEEKVEVVGQMIKMFEDQRGVVIRKDPRFYVEEMEQMRIENPELFLKPVGLILKVLFVTHCDFDDGRDPARVVREEIAGAGDLNPDACQGGGEEEYYQAWLESGQASR